MYTRDRRKELKFINYNDGKLFLDDGEISDPLENQIQIKVISSGVNRADILQKNGHYPPPKGESEIIGLECSGIIEKIGDQVETGTFYMNRCDYLDPALSWTGVKETGKGCSLSEVAYEKLTAPKSYHLRKEQ